MLSHKPKFFESLLLFSLFFLSGLTGLIYESVWSQQLALVFGSTELAIAAVLASYMAGLALGASVASIYVNRIRKPVLVYAIIEILIAISALAIPFLLDLVKHTYSAFYITPEITSISPKFAIMYVLGSFLVLLIPTTLMGATLPLLSKYIVKTNNNIGGKIGALYATNTFGACLGALISAFVLLPKFGLSATIYIAVAINAFIFISGVLLFNKKSVEIDRINTVNSAQLNNIWMLVIMLFSGVVSLASEVMWARLLSQVLGSSVYSFGVMLFVFLFGIALGAAIGSWLCKKFNSINMFVIVQIGIGLSFFISFYHADYLTQLPLQHDFGSLSFVYEGLFLGLLTLLPGALFIGTTFPLAVNICVNNYQQSGLVSAKVYTWNTIGAIFGAMLMGFYLLPQWGFATSAKILFSISLILALITALKSSKPIILTSFVSIVMLAVLLTPLSAPMQLLKYTVLGSKVQKGDVEYFGIGESTTVMLLDHGADMRLLTNGLPESSIQMQGSRVGNYFLANWLSMLPTLANQQAEDMLIVGLGAGLTLKATPKLIKNIDVVELEPEVILANKKMSEFRGVDPLKDPRVRIHHNDARNALNNSSKKFDIIVSQPSHPWTAGAANLYTQEFFALVNSRLNENGKFIQWIGMRFVDDELLKSLLATLNSEFEYVELYQPLSRGGLVFLASNIPINLDEKAFKNRQNKAQWSEIGITSWQEFQVAKRIDSNTSKKLSANIETSTDYYNILKIRSPKILKNSLNLKSLNKLVGDNDHLIKKMNTNENFVIIRELLRQRDLTRANKLVSHIENKNHRNILNAIIADKVNNNKATQNRLLKLLSLGIKTDEILYFLLTRNLNSLAKGKLPNKVQQQLKTNEIAQQLANGWRLLQLNKWQQLQYLEPLLESIDRKHPAYKLATLLRIGWRCLSNNVNDLQTALTMIDSQLAVNNEIELLNRRFNVSLKLKDYHTAIASIYELISNKHIIQRKRYKLKLHIEKSFRILKKDFINSGIKDDRINHKIIKLGKYLQALANLKNG